MKDCIFCQIARHEIPKEFTYEDEEMMVFPDIYPLGPIHLLIMPKKHLEDFLDLTNSDLTNKLREIIQKIVRKTGLEKKGYRLVVNGGGAQIIKHLHVHLIGPVGSKEVF